MGRLARHGIVVIVAALVLGPGCSAGDGTTDTQASASTTSAPSSPDPTTGAEAEAGTTPPAGEGTVEVLDPAAPGPAPTVVDRPAAEAQGWRLVLTHPTAGATVGKVAVLCYEVTGPRGASGIGFDVTLGGGAPIHVAGSVGRAAAEVDLGATGYDPQNLKVQLVVDGQRVDGASVTIPGVLVVPAAAAPDCA